MKKVKKFIKSNIKVVIAFILGISIAGSIGVYAATVIASASVSYDNSDSGLTSTNLQDALDEVYTNAKTKIAEAKQECPDGNICGTFEELSESFMFVKVGDYVQMTPSSTSYTISTSMTGYSSTQTINPSKLNLWRVIRINSDGTIEMVSQYVSSIDVYFSGKTGYKNLVSSLNTLANQYKNSSYTISSRHMGYSTQSTRIINDTALDSAAAPQRSSTSSSNVTSTTEAKGLGDVGYETDYNLVNTALGTLVANKVGTTTATAYWLASRYYQYGTASIWNFNGRIISTSGSLSSSTLHGYNSGSRSFALRPIVTLKSGLTSSSGDGSSISPYVLS